VEKRVLIVDDDAKLRKLLEEYLSDYGFHAVSLPDGLSILEKMSVEGPDIIILDVMMPEKDGLEVLREIRTASGVPVIMLTAKGEDSDRIVGLELGADDYLPKPFNPRELLARMKAVLRRVDMDGKGPHENHAQTSLRSGGLVLHRAKQTLYIDDEEVILSTTEYKILEVLMSHPNRVLSRDQIMTMARGRDFMAFDRSIDMHVSKLRAKLSPFSTYGKAIRTVWGTGYMFVDEA